MSRKSWIGGLAAILFAIVLVTKSRSIAEYFAGFIFNSDQTAAQYPAVTISNQIGLITVRHNNATEFQPLNGQNILFHLDQINVPPQSSIQIESAGGWTIAVYENSLLSIELYRPGQTDSPVLISLARGKFQVLAKGQPGLLYIMQNKQIFSPDILPREEVRVASISEDKKLKEKNTTSTELTPSNRPKLNNEIDQLPDIVPTRFVKTMDTESKPTLPSPVADIIKNEGEETLSSHYIERTLELHASDLRHCQMNSFRDNKSLEGTLLFSFTISPKGRVKDLKVIQDKINNKQLSLCTSAVIERTQFKMFAGAPIKLTYPVEFR